MTISRCIDLRLQPRATISRGQPVEQLGVRGRAAVEAEVAGRLDQARSEVCLPEPVDHDPREERVLRAGNPRRQPPRAAAPRARRAAGRTRRPGATTAATPPAATDVTRLVRDCPGSARASRRPLAARRRTPCAAGRPAMIAVVSISPMSRPRSARRSASQGRGDRRGVDVVAERGGRGGDLRLGRAPGRRPGPATIVPASIRLPPAGACRRPKTTCGFARGKRDRAGRLVRLAVRPAVAEERGSCRRRHR